MSKKLIAGAGVVASFAVALAPLATFATVSSDASDQHTDQLVLTVLPSCTFGTAAKSTSPYPSGITHDGSTGNYAADTTNGEHTATAWNNGDSEHTPTASDASGALHSGSGNTTDHNTGDIESTGYGILDGEGGVIVESGTEGQEGYVAGNDRYNASEHTVHRSMLAGTHTANFAQTTMYIVCNNGDGYTVKATATALTNGTETISPAATIDSTHAASGYNGVVTTSDSESAPTNLANITSTSEVTIADKNSVTKEAGDSITVTYGMGIKTSQKADTYAGTVTYKLYKGVNSGS